MSHATVLLVKAVTWNQNQTPNKIYTGTFERECIYLHHYFTFTSPKLLNKKFPGN